MKLYNADCLNVLKKMKENSIDSIVTDPPYGISMLEKWDDQLPPDEIWRECNRVLKPGGFILAFSSARTYHHLARSMEGVGFETQNMLAWLYGDGFPKGSDLAIEFDRNDGIPKPDDKFRKYLRKAIDKSGYKIKELEKICGTKGMFTHYLGNSQPSFPTSHVWKILKKALSLDSQYDDIFASIEKKRESTKSKKEGPEKTRHFKGLRHSYEAHQAQSKLAKQWDGWKVGKQVLRPCLEPIYFGQKTPLRPVRDNVKQWTVGAINVKNNKIKGRDNVVRFPGNVYHDGSSEVANSLSKGHENAASMLGEFSYEQFFFVPKPRRSERGENFHPTVKPIDLMLHLASLITPPKGIVLDPFMGSGTTGVACKRGGFQFVGIEREKDYFSYAKHRLMESRGNQAA